MAKNEFSMAFRAEKRNLMVARSFVSSVISSYFSQEEVVPVEMCVNELCENIIKHAYKDAPDEIRICVKVEPKQVRVTVIDKGPEFDLRKYMPMSNEELFDNEVKGKLGIRAIKKICNKIHYTRLKDKNKIEITRERAAAAEM